MTETQTDAKPASPRPTTGPAAHEDTTKGLLLAIGAYGFWGLAPIYMKQLQHIGAFESLAHRVIWSVPCALIVLMWMGRTADLKAALRSPRTLAMAGLTAALITLNWGTYLWAVMNDHMVDTALGYFINPLISIFLSMVLLREPMSRPQILAISLAFLAVAYLTIEAGRLPLVALILALSWSAYAYFKRALPIGPNQGFTLEAIIVLPFALVYAIWLGVEHKGAFISGGLTDTLLLVGLGPVTAIPLMVYSNGAKLLRLSTIAILQYISPSLILISAVFLYGEKIDHARMIAFPMIWLALAIYTGSMYFKRR